MARRATRKHRTQADKFCSCIKKVRAKIQLRPGQAKTKKNRESAAIGTCVKAVLQTKGRTLKRFSCEERPSLQTQSIKK
jgi:hypothetical protein